jgi:heme A synthase
VNSLRRLSYITLGIALTHLVFGAIVRISGSGMGCGDNWPKCYGHWFPPFDQPTLIIEWSHRLLAALLITAVVALAATAFTKRALPAVGGRRGVLRASLLAAVTVVVTALFGAVTVWLGNVWWATLVHWLLAATLLAALAAAVVRAGGLGGVRVLGEKGSVRAARGAMAAAGLALIVLLFGGMTAKFPGASGACPSFPLCGSPLSLAPQHVQMTHRILAFLLFFHVLGLVIAFARRNEAPIVVRAARIAFGFVLLQILVAGAMIGMHMPPELRSLHQAVGVGIWLSIFTLAYLARIAAREPDERTAPLADAARAGARSARGGVGKGEVPAVASHGVQP